MSSFSQRCKWFSIGIKLGHYTFSPSQPIRCIVEVVRIVFIAYLHVFNSLWIKMWFAFCLLRKVRDWKCSKAALYREVGLREDALSEQNQQIQCKSETKNEETLSFKNGFGAFSSVQDADNTEHGWCSGKTLVIVFYIYSHRNNRYQCTLGCIGCIMHLTKTVLPSLPILMFPLILVDTSCGSSCALDCQGLHS